MSNLGQHLKFSNGKTSPNRTDTGFYPVYGANGIIGYSSEYNSDENTIIIGRVGSYCGSVHFSDKKCWVTDNAISARSMNLKESIFWFYYLKSLNLNSMRVGSGQPLLNQTILKSISLPDLNINKIKVGEILLSFDQKIDLNTQINQTLEQIAQALFKSWFVDFDPMRAKVQALSDGLSLEQAELAAMQAISGKTPEELTALSQTQPDHYAELAETAKAFPCEMVEVDGVEVPKGWELSTIGEEVETVGGATPSTKEESFWNNGKIAWTTPKDLSSATSPVLINAERKITELGLKKISSGLLPIGTVLLSSRAPVGYLALTKIPVAINQGYIAIKCNKTLSNFYMLQWCKENLEEIKSRASGTTFLEISKTTFRGISVIVPEKNILIMFNKQCESIYEMITTHTKENQDLEKARDLLLPRLLKGEILNG
ncbi:restriction endonuclease subunit S [Neisseria sp. P0006.S004]|uniref:restriction endonuclease subunit S n=1 Tax=unclassified Neisseria TaxID=2623750 RepID=UPI003F81F39A